MTHRREFQVAVCELKPGDVVLKGMGVSGTVRRTTRLGWGMLVSFEGGAHKVVHQDLPLSIRPLGGR